MVYVAYFSFQSQEILLLVILEQFVLLAGITSTAGTVRHNQCSQIKETVIKCFSVGRDIVAIARFKHLNIAVIDGGLIRLTTSPMTLNFLQSTFDHSYRVEI